MKYFLDTEFIEDGAKGIFQLISIGVTDELGRTFYRVSDEFNSHFANDWVKENVLAKIPKDQKRVSLEQIKEDLIEFIEEVGPVPEFWGYYCDYDWVIICWGIFGRMIDLPKGWPMYCMDLKQLLVSVGNPKVEKLPEDQAHNALDDAIWVRDTFVKLTLKIAENSG